MSWTVLFADEFKPEFDKLGERVQDEIYALAAILKRLGPEARGPRVDTLKGSRHANLKELRFSADGGEWRLAFAFDPVRAAILLVAGDKSGVGQRKFYQNLIRVSEDRFDSHLRRLKRKGQDQCP